jgi:hypothetical protein
LSGRPEKLKPVSFFFLFFNTQKQNCLLNSGLYVTIYLERHKQVIDMNERKSLRMENMGVTFYKEDGLHKWVFYAPTFFKVFLPYVPIGVMARMHILEVSSKKVLRPSPLSRNDERVMALPNGQDCDFTRKDCINLAPRTTCARRLRLIGWLK